MNARDLLLEAYRSAVEAAMPVAALERAIARRVRGPERAIGPESRPWIFALGKAALPMAETAVRVLAGIGAEPAGGIIVAPAEAPPPHPSLEVAAGDHPFPGERSLAAAERIGRVAARVRPEDEVWGLLSGGATSLAAAPAEGLTPEDLRESFETLLGSGLDIVEMNLLRSALVRWGRGALARAAGASLTHVFVVSDVVGDDIDAIGSAPFELFGGARLEWLPMLPRLRSAYLSLPDAARRRIDRVARTVRQQHLEMKRPHPLVLHEVIVGLGPALAAAAATMERSGLRGYIVDEWLRGEAAAEGRRIAASLATHGGTFRRTGHGRDARGPLSDDFALSRPPGARWLVLGGEPVVDLRGAPLDARGGRCQELALAAARELHDRGERHVTLLAAGTDGRDGPTDAAGAIVDGDTWAAIARAGRDPGADLAAHRSYDALDAAGALLRTGLTGTNVNDIVVAVRAPASG